MNREQLSEGRRLLRRLKNEKLWKVEVDPGAGKRSTPQLTVVYGDNGPVACRFGAAANEEAWTEARLIVWLRNNAEALIEAAYRQGGDQ